MSLRYWLKQLKEGICTDMNEGRMQKASRNIVFNFLNQLLTLILSFVSRSVFIWGLGAEYLGLNGLFSDVLGLLSMADLGFNVAMVYSFYKPLAENDYRTMAGLTTFYRKVYHIIAATVAVIGLALTPALPYLINLDIAIPYINVYYLVSLSNVVFSYLCVYKTSILSADQKNYKITKISMWTNIVKTVLQIVVILFWKNYILYLAVGSITVIINNVIASKLATNEYPFIKEKTELDKGKKKDILKNIGSVFLYKVSSVLVNTTDNILISVIVGTLAVGYYSNYLMLQSKISMFYTLLFTSVTASIGNLIVNEKAEKRYSIFKCEQSVSYIICGIVIPCYIVMVSDLVNIWLGNDFVLSRGVVYAIGLNMYFSCVLQPLWSYREATGLYRKTKWIMVICAVTNLVLSVILGKMIGLAGIIMASALSRILTYVWYEPRLLFQEYFDEKPSQYYLQMISNFFMIVILVIGLEKIGGMIEVDSVWMWFFKAIIVCPVCVCVVIVVYVKSEGITILRRKIRVLFGKNE